MTTILFVEFADTIVRKKFGNAEGNSDGSERREQFYAAIVSAGQQRLMPIFLTTATTVGGLIPLALSGGPLWVGMAWPLIAGLTFATLLTLIVVPVLYSFLLRTIK